MDQPSLGRLAIWRVHRERDAVQLLIDLDHDVALAVTIGPDGQAVAALSDNLAEFLQAEALRAA
jgi:hypothetical protein